LRSDADVEAAQNVDGNDYSRLYARDLDSITPLHQSDYVLLIIVGILKQWIIQVKDSIFSPFLTIVETLKKSISQVTGLILSCIVKMIEILEQFFLLATTSIFSHITNIGFIAVLAIIGYFMWRQVERGEFPTLLLMGGGFTTTAWAIYSRLRYMTSY
jgi:hypothetical protein